jgi:putative flippase GtrA
VAKAKKPLTAEETAIQKAKNKETLIQFFKNFFMGFVVTILESLSLNPLYKLFDGTWVAEKFGLLLVANSVSIVIFFFVRFFVNYFWVFHSKKNILNILPLFAVLIVVFSWSTTELIDLMIKLFNMSASAVELLGDDTIRLISKLTVTYVMGMVNFAICKLFIFNDKEESKEESE